VPHNSNDQEETMAQETQSFVEMPKKFGSDLGLPKVDVEKLIATQSKNLDALSQSARIASEGAKSLAANQKEIVEAALRDAVEMVREFKPSGSPQDIVTKQSELARKVFDAALKNSQEIAELVRKTSTEAFKTIADRITESMSEIRGNIQRGVDETKKKS
jgi:phasin family protein